MSDYSLVENYLKKDRYVHERGMNNFNEGYHDIYNQEMGISSESVLLNEGNIKYIAIDQCELHSRTKKRNISPTHHRPSCEQQ